MQIRLGVLVTATVLTAIAVPRATFPHRAALHADANDQRTPAGRMVDGELRVELDVVDLTWSPRGPQGPLRARGRIRRARPRAAGAWTAAADARRVLRCAFPFATRSHERCGFVG